MKKLAISKETVSSLRVRGGIRTGKGIDLSLHATCPTLVDACHTNAGCPSQFAPLCSVGCKKEL